jgi:hypothetical protein
VNENQPSSLLLFAAQVAFTNPPFEKEPGNEKADVEQLPEPIVNEGTPVQPSLCENELVVNIVKQKKNNNFPLILVLYSISTFALECSLIFKYTRK